MAFFGELAILTVITIGSVQRKCWLVVAGEGDLCAVVCGDNIVVLLLLADHIALSHGRCGVPRGGEDRGGRGEGLRGGVWVSTGVVGMGGTGPSGGVQGEFVVIIMIYQLNVVVKRWGVDLYEVLGVKVNVVIGGCPINCGQLCREG